jgi:uncharacterized repeat protein (TIGR02543 family)
MVTATPDGAHDFAGWSGDAGGTSNPLAVLMDRAKTVQANFSPKSFSLVDECQRRRQRNARRQLSVWHDRDHHGGGRRHSSFVGWAGDASGSAPSIALTITPTRCPSKRCSSLKTVQTIAFPAIGDQSVGASIPLTCDFQFRVAGDADRHRTGDLLGRCAHPDRTGSRQRPGDAARRRHLSPGCSGHPDLQRGGGRRSPLPRDRPHLPPEPVARRNPSHTSSSPTHEIHSLSSLCSPWRSPSSPRWPARPPRRKPSPRETRRLPTALRSLARACQATS